jgi:hypothetical protein
LVHQGWSLSVRIGVVIYRENNVRKVVICLENLHHYFYFLVIPRRNQYKTDASLQVKKENISIDSGLHWKKVELFHLIKLVKMITV